MHDNGVLSYLLGDHLGSTSLTLNASGVQTGEMRYHPIGETRYSSGATPTQHRFTGQLEDAGTGLYFYNARYYDPALGLFTQADTIVPDPANPQTLNRYMYVYGNPLKYIDPTGHEGCAAGDDACWEREWHAKNDWFNARGKYYSDLSGEWTDHGVAVVRTRALAEEILVEAGMVLKGLWLDDNEVIEIATGVSDLARAVRGFGRLRTLFNGVVRIYAASHRPIHACVGGAGCAISPEGNTIYAYGTRRITRIWAVHELAHIIDQNSYIERTVRLGPTTVTIRGAFSDVWQGEATSAYGACQLKPGGCVPHWEKWAEAVVAFVYPTAPNVSRLTRRQNATMSRLLWGWGWSDG